MMRMLLALAAAALLIASSAASPVFGKSKTLGKSTKEDVNYRLPNEVVPTAYAIKIVPFLDDEAGGFPFQGTVDIVLEVKTATSAITLHSNQLVLADDLTTVKDAAGNSIGVVAPLEFVTETQFLIVRLSEPLKLGTVYTLHLEFSGKLNTDMDGFYRSSYVENGVTKWIATTQMEPSDARKAFPCFDEPALKAPITVTVGRKETEVALANMPRDTSVPISEPDAAFGGRVWETFMPTPPMATYLVAFIISEFKSLPADDDTATFRVWARPEALEQAHYALEVGPPIMTKLEEFFNMDYGVPKVDNVAISDFSAGAMENWGLVTYREASLLYDPAVSTESNKQRVATVLAHEFAHFWFGDTVTLEWWEYTWLNEGFARYFQVIAVDEVFPEWEILDQFVVDTVQPILRTDSLLTTPMLTQPCGSPAACNANFGTITYNKGGSILRMLDHILTRPTFQKGLRNYLENNKFHAVTPALLFSELQLAAVEDGVLGEGVTVRKVMESWTLKPGHPYVRVSGLTDDKSTLVITQERVLLRPDPENPDTSLWWIPLTWTRQSDSAAQAKDTKPMEWLREEQSLLLKTDIGDKEWVIFNTQQTGYYRVAYDTHYWSLIVAALQNATEMPNIHELNRAQIVDDALNLARSEIIGYEAALEATLYLKDEVAYGPWYAAFNGFDFLDSRLVASDGFSAFKRYVLNSMDKLYKELTFDATTTESQKTVLGRVNALKWACKYGLQDCVDHAITEFSTWMANVANRVAPNKKSVVYCTALREGPGSYWDFLWEQYLTTNLAADQVTILSALGCTNDKSRLNEYLLKSVTDNSGIRLQDAPSVFSAVYSNPEGVDPALDFLIENLPAINSHYLGSNTLGNSITGLAGRLTTQAQVDKLKQFATDNEELLSTTSAFLAVGKAIEAAEADLRWGDTHAETILDWMGRHAPSSAQGVQVTVSALVAAVLVWTATHF